MKSIKLDKGLTTLVDDDDYDKLIELGATWYASARFGRTYAACHGPKESQNGKLLYMHRFIMSPPEDMVVDHKNKCGLDNRKQNLRVVTKSQNLHNRKLNRNNTSGYIGVALCKDTNKWRATIMIERQRYHLGRFDSLEAANAARRLAKELLLNG